MIFGNKLEFAIEYIEKSDGLDKANVYIAGKNITPVDNCHYQLAGNLNSEASYFINKVNWFKNGNELPKESVEKMFSYINERELRFSYRVLDWGPPTDGSFFMVIPFDDRLYLYGELDGIDAPFGTEIKPFNIACTLIEAERHITNCSI